MYFCLKCLHNLLRIFKDIRVFATDAEAFLFFVSYQEGALGALRPRQRLQSFVSDTSRHITTDEFVGMLHCLLQRQERPLSADKWMQEAVKFLTC